MEIVTCAGEKFLSDVFSVANGNYLRYRACMRNNIKAKGSITKPLLAGLVIPTLSKLPASKTETEKPSFGKTDNKQADLAHDGGNGFNPDLSFIQD